MSEKYSSPFDSYEWPSPWENKNNKKNPFDTNSTSINQDTSAFDDIKEWKIQDTSTFDDNKSNLLLNKKNPFESSNNKYTNNKKFVYFNPEWLPSARKNKKIGDTIVKKHLKDKYKITEKSDLLKNELKNEFPSINVNKSLKKSNNQLLDEAKSDLKIKENLLQKDKEHNFDVKTLETQGKTKTEILQILNLQNRPKDYFIKYNKEKLSQKNIWLLNIALDAYSHKDTLWAKHCTDWIDKIYKQSLWISVYDSNTLFNWVKRISKWTWIGVEEYANNEEISEIKAWDHIIVDKPRWWKYGVWRTHSILALWQPNNWLLKAISYPNYNSQPVIEYIDLYGMWRAKNWKPIRIQWVA